MNEYYIIELINILISFVLKVFIYLNDADVCRQMRSHCRLSHCSEACRDVRVDPVNRKS